VYVVGYQHVELGIISGADVGGIYNLGSDGGLLLPIYLIYKGQHIACDRLTKTCF